MQEIWKAIEKVVLLGTHRAQLPEKIKQHIRRFPLHLHAAEAPSLLQSLSFFHYLKKGAARLPQLEELPPSVPDETLAVAPRVLQALIEKMRSDDIYKGVIPEYLKLTIDHGVLLAPSALYYLFEYYKNDLEGIALIQEVMGNAGLWLCRQNPEWAIFNPLNREQLWEYGTAEDRQQALLQLRMDDPNGARALLFETWPSESWRNQLLFLSTLMVESSEDDIPFLESCLKAQSKDIRQLAGKVLCTIPASGFNEKIAELFLEIIDLEADNLSFTTPIDTSKLSLLANELAYSLEPIKWDKQHKLALALSRYFMAQMAPTQWEKILQVKTSTAYRYLEESAYFSRLKGAIAQSIHLHQDVHWMPLFLKPFLDLEKTHWDHEAIQRLASHLPYAVFESLARHYTRFHKNILDANSLMYFILIQNEHAWPHELSLNIIQIFQDYLQYSRTYFGDDTDHYEDLLEVIALRSDPYLLSRLQIGWPQGSFSWYRWEPQVKKMLRILHFRSALQKAFEPEGV